MVLYDKDIREPLFDYLEEMYGKIRILEEKTMGDSRADVVMITEEKIIGIEIKSDADTYARLSRQVKDYDRFFDLNIVAVGSTHGNNITKHVPAHWGIITIEIIDDKIDFYFLRKPDLNKNVEWKRKLKLMWRPELAKIQEYFNMPKYKDKSKDFVIEKICARIPEKIQEEELNRMMCEILFERDYTTVKNDLIEFRKSELQKKIEKETDPKKQIELMMEKAEKSSQLTGERRRRRRR